MSRIVIVASLLDVSSLGLSEQNSIRISHSLRVDLALQAQSATSDSCP
jgi:hypothetical protein